MPKLHKSKFGIRPIINCNLHPTSKISLLIDCLLKQIVLNTESYIKDAQHLIQKVQFLSFSQNCSLYSCDFDSLYTNILLNDATNYICDYVKDKLDVSLVSIYGFKTLLEILFNNNYFVFNTEIYKQKSGVAMGTICAPNIANIYVYCLERKFLHIYKPLFYYRFIDDIFIIVDSSFNIQILLNSFESLTLNIVTDKIVNFLNLNISLCKFTGVLLFTTYFKPTNTFSYLLKSSNHPSHIFKNIPFGLFYSIRRTCSDLSNYLYNSRKVFQNLLKRGYDYKLLSKTSNTIALMNRKDLIPYKTNKNHFNTTNNLFIKLPFEANLNDRNIDLQESFLNCIKNNEKLNNFNLKILYSKQYSLKDLFINHFKLSINSYSFKKCFYKNCLLCFFSIKESFLYLNNFPLFCFKNSTCYSKNCIYIIKCKLCFNYFYVGQTEDIGQRIKTHIRDILSFIVFTKFTSVSIHFNLKNHDLFKHFSVFIVNSKILKENLFSNENYYINLLKDLKMNLINEKNKIPDKKYIQFKKIGDFL
jgi:predicted GIY-YIG superfamily endonuclease